jgi:uridine kinase
MITLGLSGGSGSGKSTLIERVMSEFSPGIICHLPMDAYYLDHGYLTPKQKKTHNFDHPDAIDFRLLAGHIQQLKLGLPIERPQYSFLTCSRIERTTTVYPSKILLIDGIFALNDPEISNQMDVKLFLSVSEENRLLRTIARDTRERGRTKEMVEKRFFDTVKPMLDIYVEPFMKSANKILDGNSTDIESISNEFRRILDHYLEHIHETL